MVKLAFLRKPHFWALQERWKQRMQFPFGSSAEPFRVAKMYDSYQLQLLYRHLGRCWVSWGQLACHFDQLPAAVLLNGLTTSISETASCTLKPLVTSWRASLLQCLQHSALYLAIYTDVLMTTAVASRYVLRQHCFHSFNIQLRSFSADICAITQ